MGALVAVAFSVAVGSLIMGSDGMNDTKSLRSGVSPPGVPLAALGDSDSHSYQDRASFPPGSGKRGGAFRATTFQWIEVLARLRGREVDPGPWGVWGTRGRIATLQEWFGLKGRAPRKEDYRNNFAISGAGCDTLMEGMSREAPRLLTLMDRDPMAWRRGVVVLRMGVNSFGLFESLDLLAQDAQAPSVRAEIDRCVEYIRNAIALIHARHPATRFVLVGIFDNSHWPKYFEHWQTPQAISNIDTGLERFDRALRAMAANDPRRLVFFDDRAWFAERWGSRDERGKPAYKPFKLASGLQVTNTSGDHPSNAVIADGHAGTIWNALWAQSLVNLLNSAFDLRLTPISDAEITEFVGTLKGVKQ
jgi:hypothetical protein